jgi:hypothetical protein
MLAALRLWQKDSAHIADGDGALADIAQKHGEALSNEDMDALILRLNCSPSPVLDEAETPVIVVEGGMVQSVFVPDSEDSKRCIPVMYSLIDYDALRDGMADSDVVEEFNSFSPALKRYYRECCKEEFEKYFENAINEACTCDDSHGTGRNTIATARLTERDRYSPESSLAGRGF